VLEVTSNILSLEGGILDIARLNLLIERTIRERVGTDVSLEYP